MCIVIAICGGIAVWRCNEAQHTVETSQPLAPRARLRTSTARFFHSLKRTILRKENTPKDDIRSSRSAACSPSLPPPYDWDWQVSDEGADSYPPLPESPAPSIVREQRCNTLQHRLCSARAIVQSSNQQCSITLTGWCFYL